MRRCCFSARTAIVSSLTTAVATGVLYVALLVVLGLFADLIVSRGEIPLFRNLSRGEQDSFLRYWNSVDPEQRAGQPQLLMLLARQHLDELRPAVREVPEPVQVKRARHQEPVR